MNKIKKIILGIIILLIIIGGSFYGGMIYGKSQNVRLFNPANFQGVRTNRTGANIVSGNIISKDSESITLQLPNNSGSKIIFYSSATQIGKSVSGTANDLISGENVNITGTTNSDGTLTAQSIQIRPAGQNPITN